MTTVRVQDIAKFFMENEAICQPTIEIAIQKLIHVIRDTLSPNKEGKFPLVLTVLGSDKPKCDANVVLCDDIYYTIRVETPVDFHNAQYIGEILYVGESVLRKALSDEVYRCALRYDLPINIELCINV